MEAEELAASIQSLRDAHTRRLQTLSELKTAGLPLVEALAPLLSEKGSVNIGSNLYHGTTGRNGDICITVNYNYAGDDGSFWLKRNAGLDHWFLFDKDLTTLVAYLEPAADAKEVTERLQRISQAAKTL